MVQQKSINNVIKSTWLSVHNCPTDFVCTNHNIVSISDISNETAGGVDKTSSNNESLLSVTNELHNPVSEFKV